ncbi:MAG: PKD domain-containing protein [Saprospiraceae bacterium]|nr:PKD domain-containing protein [Candidatus Vicinibacter affinis]
MDLDGNSSSDLNPKHTYGQPGEYKVTLEIVVKGEYCKIEKIIKVGNGLAPCPFDFDFSVDQLVVKFKPTFQQKYESLVWYFGDRTESKEEFPVHTYANEGLYQVTLVAYFNGVPCKVTKDIKISKFQNPPVGIAIIDVNPNPVDENMMIKIKSDSKVSVTLTVADVTGVNLKKIPVALEVGENLVDWNVAELATGTYLIYLYHENTIVSRYKFQKN